MNLVLEYDEIERRLNLRFGVPSESIDYLKVDLVGDMLMDKIAIDANFTERDRIPKQYHGIFYDLLTSVYFDTDLLYQDYDAMKDNSSPAIGTEDKITKSTGGIKAIREGDTETQFYEPKSTSSSSTYIGVNSIEVGNPSSLVKDNARKFDELYWKLIDKIRKFRW